MDAATCWSVQKMRETCTIGAKNSLKTQSVSDPWAPGTARLAMVYAVLHGDITDLSQTREFLHVINQFDRTDLT